MCTSSQTPEAVTVKSIVSPILKFQVSGLAQSDFKKAIMQGEANTIRLVVCHSFLQPFFDHCSHINVTSFLPAPQLDPRTVKRPSLFLSMNNFSVVMGSDFTMQSKLVIEYIA